MGRGLGLWLVLGPLAAAAADLDRTSPMHAVRRHQRALKACYATALRFDPAVRGKIVFGVDVAPTGRVTAVSTVSTTLAAPRLERCLLRVVAQARFSPEDAGQHLTVPLVLLSGVM